MIVSDVVGDSPRPTWEASATQVLTIATSFTAWTEKVSMKIGQHPTKLPQSLLFIGLPDGEVFLYHLTKDLTRDLTIHCLLCVVATLGKAMGRRA